MVSRIDNLEFRHTVRQTVSSRLEEVTAEYESLFEPLRVALNVVLAAPSSGWQHALYSVGDDLSVLDLSDAAWPCFREPGWEADDDEWGRWVALECVRAAATQDSREYERLSNVMRTMPGVGAAAASSIHPLALILFQRGRNAARDRTLEKARRVVRTVGLELTSACLPSLRRAESHPPPKVEDALAHWVDPECFGARVIDGQIAPLGDRRPLFGVTVRGTVEEPKERGGPPAELGSGDTNCGSVLSVYTGGASDEAFARVSRVARDQTKTVHERLIEIDGLLHIPPTASAKTLGDMLGVSATAVKNTAWWDANRKDKKRQEIAGREDRMRGRGGVYE